MKHIFLNILLLGFLAMQSCSKEPLCKNYSGQKAITIFDQETLVDTIGSNTYIIHCDCYYTFKGLLLKESEFEIVKDCDLIN